MNKQNIDPCLTIKNVLKKLKLALKDEEIENFNFTNYFQRMNRNIEIMSICEKELTNHLYYRKMETYSETIEILFQCFKYQLFQLVSNEHNRYKVFDQKEAKFQELKKNYENISVKFINSKKKNQECLIELSKLKNKIENLMLTKINLEQKLKDTDVHSSQKSKIEDQKSKNNITKLTSIVHIDKGNIFTAQKNQMIQTEDDTTKDYIQKLKEERFNEIKKFQKEKQIIENKLQKANQTIHKYITENETVTPQFQIKINNLEELIIQYDVKVMELNINNEQLQNLACSLKAENQELKNNRDNLQQQIEKSVIEYDQMRTKYYEEKLNLRAFKDKNIELTNMIQFLSDQNDELNQKLFNYEEQQMSQQDNISQQMREIINEKNRKLALYEEEFKKLIYTTKEMGQFNIKKKQNPNSIKEVVDSSQISFSDQNSKNLNKNETQQIKINDFQQKEDQISLKSNESVFYSYSISSSQQIYFRKSIEPKKQYKIIERFLNEDELLKFQYIFQIKIKNKEISSYKKLQYEDKNILNYDKDSISDFEQGANLMNIEKQNELLPQKKHKKQFSSRNIQPSFQYLSQKHQPENQNYKNSNRNKKIQTIYNSPITQIIQNENEVCYYELNLERVKQAMDILANIIGFQKSEDIYKYFYQPKKLQKLNKSQKRQSYQTVGYYFGHQKEYSKKEINNKDLINNSINQNSKDNSNQSNIKNDEKNQLKKNQVQTDKKQIKKLKKQTIQNNQQGDFFIEINNKKQVQTIDIKRENEIITKNKFYIQDNSSRIKSKSNFVESLQKSVPKYSVNPEQQNYSIMKKKINVQKDSKKNRIEYVQVNIPIELRVNNRDIKNQIHQNQRQLMLKKTKTLQDNKFLDQFEKQLREKEKIYFKLYCKIKERFYESPQSLYNIFLLYFKHKPIFFSEKSTHFDLDFEQFKREFMGIVQIHESCGKNCIHLKRFYSQTLPQRLSAFKELRLNSTLINELNELIQFYNEKNLKIVMQ